MQQLESAIDLIGGISDLCMTDVDTDGALVGEMGRWWVMLFHQYSLYRLGSCWIVADSVWERLIVDLAASFKNDLKGRAYSDNHY